MVDISYDGIGGDILFHILRYSTKEIGRLSNISLFNVEGGTSPYLAKVSPCLAMKDFYRISAHCYLNGVIEILCKYLQSAWCKYWLPDGSTLMAWYLQVRQFWDKLRRIMLLANFVNPFHWITQIFERSDNPLIKIPNFPYLKLKIGEIMLMPAMVRPITLTLKLSKDIW